MHKLRQYTGISNGIARYSIAGTILFGIAMAAVLGILLTSAQTSTQAQDDCAVQWVFNQELHQVAACPEAEVVANMFAHLEFERGEMLWNAADNTIYVLYRDGQAPYWESYPDTFIQGQPERDPSIIGPAGLWQQPRRGFGLLWRTNATVRDRLGWALNEWETSYPGYLQKGRSSAGQEIFFTREDNKMYHLHPNGIWELFTFL